MDFGGPGAGHVAHPPPRLRGIQARTSRLAPALPAPTAAKDDVRQTFIRPTGSWTTQRAVPEAVGLSSRLASEHPSPFAIQDRYHRLAVLLIEPHPPNQHLLYLSPQPNTPSTSVWTGCVTLHPINPTVLCLAAVLIPHVLPSRRQEADMRFPSHHASLL
ncbi:hypothetical protein BDV95DRAFT_608946 [Massariosphaeria phaeospora]|uniref:Uncharacterized protein n=1 Tax=Massariosphaeria phaeospora TaxID=100035 RepID=A0A7C8M798_9PLEO|nr:hypothetical protein BDV95DRAFT_608946 [Massariosphaeria phaeospora]